MITQIKKEVRLDNGIHDPLTQKIIAVCFKVHSELGPGFVEKVYHNAVKLVLEQEGLKYTTEKAYKINYGPRSIGTLRVDLIVQDEVIVELKAVASNILPEVFKYQLLSYLKVSGLTRGLLVNFGNKSCQVKRLVN